MHTFMVRHEQRPAAFQRCASVAGTSSRWMLGMQETLIHLEACRDTLQRFIVNPCSSSKQSHAMDILNQAVLLYLKASRLLKASGHQQQQQQQQQQPIIAGGKPEAFKMPTDHGLMMGLAAVHAHLQCQLGCQTSSLCTSQPKRLQPSQHAEPDEDAALQSGTSVKTRALRSIPKSNLPASRASHPLRAKQAHGSSLAGTSSVGSPSLPVPPVLQHGVTGLVLANGLDLQHQDVTDIMIAELCALQHLSARSHSDGLHDASAANVAQAGHSQKGKHHINSEAVTCSCQQLPVDHDEIQPGVDCTSLARVAAQYAQATADFLLSRVFPAESSPAQHSQVLAAAAVALNDSKDDFRATQWAQVSRAAGLLDAMLGKVSQLGSACIIPMAHLLANALRDLFAASLSILSMSIDACFASRALILCHCDMSCVGV